MYRKSVKTRVTLFTLLIFVFSLWSLAFYISQLLRQDIERQLGEQQFSTVSTLARAIDQQLVERLRALELAAGSIRQEWLNNPSALQTFLDQQSLLPFMFSGGVFITGHTGTALAESPASMGRVGINFMERDAIAAALQQGVASIGRPLIGKQPVLPVFGMVAPIRDARQQVIGSLVGVVALDRVDFIEHLAQSHYGKTGGYFLVSIPDRLIITATHKERIMKPLAPAGQIPAIDRFLAGFEGTQVYVNQKGIEVMNSSKRLQHVNWGVSVSIPTAEVFEPIVEMQRRMLLATVVLTLLVGGITWRMIQRQLSPLTETAKTLADWSVHEQGTQVLPVHGQDEIGALIQAFNRLLSVLQTRQQALRDSEYKLSLILDNVEAHIYLKDREGRYLYANRQVLALFGKSLQEVIGRDDRDFFDANTAMTLKINDLMVLQGGQTVKTLETNVSLQHGKTFSYWSVKLPLRNEQGEIYALCGISTDITERKIAEDRIRNSEEQLRMVLEGAELGFWDWNVQTNQVIRNECWAHMLGYRLAELENSVRQWADFIYPDDRERAWQSIQAVLEGKTEAHILEYRMLHKDGSVRWILDKAKVTQRDAQGRPLRMSGIHSDITERKQLELELFRQAHIDYLTGVSNRRYFMEQAEQALALAKRYDNPLALCMLDIDFFKKINDKHGHKAGDQVLKALVEISLKTLREVDVIGRIGGEEFAILLPETQPAQAMEVAERLRLALAASDVTLELGAHVQFTVSIGVSGFQSEQDHVELLLNRADQALYKAKQAGRNRVCLYG